MVVRSACRVRNPWRCPTLPEEVLIARNFRPPIPAAYRDTSTCHTWAQCRAGAVAIRSTSEELHEHLLSGRAPSKTYDDHERVLSRRWSAEGTLFPPADTETSYDVGARRGTYVLVCPLQGHTPTSPHVVASCPRPDLGIPIAIPPNTVHAEKLMS